MICSLGYTGGLSVADICLQRWMNSTGSQWFFLNLNGGGRVCKAASVGMSNNIFTCLRVPAMLGCSSH